MKKQIANTKHFSIWEREEKPFEYVSLNAAEESVMILPLLDSEHIICISKYCPASDTTEIVLPGGKVEGDVSVEETVRKELEEETRYTAQDIIPGTTLQILPAYFVGKTQWFIAKGLRPSSFSLDSEEVSAIHIFSVDEFAEMIKKGEIMDSRTIAVFLSYLIFYREK